MRHVSTVAIGLFLVADLPATDAAAQWNDPGGYGGYGMSQGGGQPGGRTHGGYGLVRARPGRL